MGVSAFVRHSCQEKYMIFSINEDIPNDYLKGVKCPVESRKETCLLITTLGFQPVGSGGCSRGHEEPLSRTLPSHYPVLKRGSSEGFTVSM